MVGLKKERKHIITPRIEAILLGSFRAYTSLCSYKKMGPLGKESEKQVKPAKRSFQRRIEGCTCVILISMQTNVALSATLSSNCTSNELQAQAFSLKRQESTITYLVSICSSENRYANVTPVPRAVVGLW